MSAHIKIVSRWDSASVLWEGEADSIADAIKKARASDANLGGAYLGGANLGGANLRDAYLGGAYLGGAYLGGANLGGAYLGDANLGGANLRDAYLGGAYLGGANLGGANLRDAYLGDAYLGGAYLGGANQEELKKRGAIFDGPRRPGPKEDIWSVLDQAPAEVPALLTALREGRINGTLYEGECACLVGTIANARGCHYQAVDGLVPDSGRPAERWFYGIRPGRTPDKSSRARRTVEWIEEWQAARAAPVVPTAEVTS